MAIALALGLIGVGYLIKSSASRPTDATAITGVFFVVVGGLMLLLTGKEK